MAAHLSGMITRVFCRISPLVLKRIRQSERIPALPWSPVGFLYFQSSNALCTVASSAEKTTDAVENVERVARYKERPWDYLESEEYSERYGSRPVWIDYRRNHKGGIPPQKTRKNCIRGDQICGNPCPICRDPNIIIHHQNVKLLQQFISPYTGIVHDPTRTGVCMKQQKQLTKAIDTARDHGLLPFQVPYVDHSGEDYTNSHDAVGCTPPHPTVTAGEPWYPWYQSAQPDEREVAKVRKIYKAYLK